MEKIVTIEIEIPVTYEVTPGEPGFFRGQKSEAEISSIDFDIAAAEAEIWTALEDPGLIDELREHAEAMTQKAKDDEKINQWELQESIEGRR